MTLDQYTEAVKDCLANELMPEKAELVDAYVEADRDLVSKLHLSGVEPMTAAYAILEGT